MRSAAASLAAVALVLALLAAASGAWLASDLRAGVEAGLAVLPRARTAPAGMVHAVAGIAASCVAGVLASIAFLLGLQGLLDSERRTPRVGAIALFAFGPALMALAVAASLSGHAEWRDVHLGRLRPAPFEAFVNAHGVVITSGFVAVLAGFALAAAVGRALSRGEDDDG